MTTKTAMPKKILIIDDDEMNLTLVRARLIKEHYDVITARDGDIGLEQAELHRPDAIILDVEMPRMNGYTFMVEIKKIAGLETTPVIVLTAHHDKQPIFAMKGVRGYLIKPIDFTLFFEKLNACFAQKPSQKILIIEQPGAQQKLIDYFLGAAGYDNRSNAVTADEGLAIATVEQPDIVIISNLLREPPEKICQRIHAQNECAAIPLIVLTDTKNPVDASAIHVAGGIACVERSAKYEKLIEAVRAYTPSH